MGTAFVDHCLELLNTLGPVRARRMFGGHGLYAQDLFVALIAGDRLYVKVDRESESRFVAAGCEPFVYEGQGTPVRMSYWTVPDEAMEAASLMAPWARLALQAALRAAAAKAAKAETAGQTGKAAKKRRSPKAKPRALRRCPPAGPGVYSRRAGGWRCGRRHAWA